MVQDCCSILGLLTQEGRQAQQLQVMFQKKLRSIVRDRNGCVAHEPPSFSNVM